MAPSVRVMRSCSASFRSPGTTSSTGPDAPCCSNACAEHSCTVRTRTTRPARGLLSAGNLVKLAVDRPDRRRAKKRAAEIAKGDWASEAVRAAIQSAQAATTAAVAAAGAAAAGS